MLGSTMEKSLYSTKTYNLNWQEEIVFQKHLVKRVKRGLSWDDVISDDLRSVWVSHSKMMQEIGKMQATRWWVTIYATFLRKNGTYSSQLVFPRSKVVPDGLSQPGAELLAATINTHTGKEVEKGFQDNPKESVKLSDNHVTLH